MQGGHKIKHDGKKLHIQNFRLLKEKLREKFPNLDTEEIHKQADEIVKDIMTKMSNDLSYYEQEKYIDDGIMEYIKEQL